MRDRTREHAGRLLSARRALISLAMGLGAGVAVALLATPNLLPLVSWMVTVGVLLWWVWRKSWPLDARLYCVDEPDARGIDFKQEHEPTSTRIRRVALGHALLSYAFGTGILAVAINLLTNLSQ